MIAYWTAFVSWYSSTRMNRWRASSAARSSGSAANSRARCTSRSSKSTALAASSSSWYTGQSLRATSSTGLPQRGSNDSGVSRSFLALEITPAIRSIGVCDRASPSFLAARFMTAVASSGSKIE